MNKIKIYVSNLCWSKSNNYKVIKYLRKEGISGIDFAPLKYFKSWKNIITNSKKLKNFFDKNQIKINALQGIFYKTKYNIFNIKDKKKITKHFELIIQLCKVFKTKKIILGSSNFRDPCNLDIKQANLIFSNYFKSINKLLKKNNILLCIETIPKYYKEKYIFEYSHLKKLVKKIDSSNIKINFDTSVYHFQKFNKNKFLKNIKLIKNIQISQPNFDYFDKPTATNLNFIDLIKENDSFNEISLEMIDTRFKRNKFETSVSNIKKFFNI